MYKTPSAVRPQIALCWCDCRAVGAALYISCVCKPIESVQCLPLLLFLTVCVCGYVVKYVLRVLRSATVGVKPLTGGQIGCVIGIDCDGQSIFNALHDRQHVLEKLYMGLSLVSCFEIKHTASVFLVIYSLLS